MGVGGRRWESHAMTRTAQHRHMRPVVRPAPRPPMVLAARTGIW
jgi:hypothetical protein